MNQEFDQTPTLTQTWSYMRQKKILLVNKGGSFKRNFGAAWVVKNNKVLWLSQRYQNETQIRQSFGRLYQIPIFQSIQHAVTYWLYSYPT